jgi:hypothetical protein
MIESIIIDKLFADDKIQEYCNGNIFILSSPEGTKTPYIVISSEDEYDESGVISIFGITINIYDYTENKRIPRSISQKIIDILHYAELEGDGYSAVRLFFRHREPFREDDKTLCRILIQFDARACNLENK